MEVCRKKIGGEICSEEDVVVDVDRKKDMKEEMCWGRRSHPILVLWRMMPIIILVQILSLSFA